MIGWKLPGHKSTGALKASSKAKAWEVEPRTMLGELKIFQPFLERELQEIRLDVWKDDFDNSLEKRWELGKSIGKKTI